MRGSLLRGTTAGSAYSRHALRALVDFGAMIGFFDRHGVVVLIALVAFTADQLSKLGIVLTLPLYQSWPTDGFFRFTHVANSGSAFGLFGGHNVPLTLASIVGIGVLVLFYRTQKDASLWLQASLGLMFAGACGNLADRITQGHVTDFIDVGPWYIFNLADASIVTGIVLFTGFALFSRPSRNEPALVTTTTPGDEEYDG